MLKVYNKEGRSMEADPEQLEALYDAGWSRTKPEVKEEIIVKPTVKKPSTKKAAIKKPAKIKKK